MMVFWGRRARRGCLRRCEAGESAADKPEESVLSRIEGNLEMKELLFIALVIACPLMMILMMRGYGHGGHAGRSGSS